jgi:two-component system chemotaxis response regulator CheB
MVTGLGVPLGCLEAFVSRRDTIVIGASAGGVEALRVLLAGLPLEFEARMLVVLHVPANGVNTLASVLARSSRMKVRSAANRDRLEPGVILVAPPDHHLVVVDDSCLLTQGPRENGHRPAIDVLFRSAARALGPRMIGVILSGALDDGTVGLRAIRSRGGLGVVQDPDDAQHASMPRHAINAASPEYVLPVAEMPELLVRLIGTEVDPAQEAGADPQSPEQPDKLVSLEIAPPQVTPEDLPEPRRPAESSSLSCPDCRGELFATTQEDYLRFRCQVGHAWSVQSLMAEHRVAVEGALWMALRVLDEKSALCTDMSVRANDGGASISARRFAEQAADATEAADVLRDLLAPGIGTEDRQDGGRLV